MKHLSFCPLKSAACPLLHLAFDSSQNVPPHKRIKEYKPKHRFLVICLMWRPAPLPLPHTHASINPQVSVWLMDEKPRSYLDLMLLDQETWKTTVETRSLTTDRTGNLLWSAKAKSLCVYFLFHETCHSTSTRFLRSLRRIKSCCEMGSASHFFTLYFLVEKYQPKEWPDHW